jgi:predicted flap endonuclease-1-like 5' DNA nuclease
MKLLFIFLNINWSCLLPILGWMLGAFISGWLLRHLFGGSDNKAVLMEEHNNLKAKHQAVLADHTNRYSALQSKHNALQSSYASADAGKLSGALAKIEELTMALGIANNKPPVTIEKLVEKRVEIPVEKVVEKRVEIPMEDLTRIKALQIEINQLKTALEAQKNKPGKEITVEKIVEKPVEDMARIIDLQAEVNQFKLLLETERNKPAKEVIVEKRVEVPIEKIVEKIVEKPLEDMARVNALQAEVNQFKLLLETERSKPAKEVIVEKRVEVPVDRIMEKVIEKRVEVPMAAASSTRNYRGISGLFGAKIVADDLKLVEGIGPKIEELFHANGYKTWASVAKANPAQLKEILVAGGERFKMHDPATWPRQCQMIIDDEWYDLKTYQDKLRGGRVAATATPLPQKVTDKTQSAPGATGTPQKDYKALGAIYGKKIKVDDLKLVEGIGPKIEALFHKAGLKTWASVAKTNPAKLKEILVAAGERFKMHNPGTWPKQCQMMVDDKWKDLKAYQQKLDGGKAIK